MEISSDWITAVVGVSVGIPVGKSVLVVDVDAAGVDVGEGVWVGIGVAIG